MSRGVFALILAALFSFGAPRVLAAAQSESKEAAAWREVEENRARREIGAIYSAMAAAQKRGDTKAALKFFARDVQVVTDSGARLGFKDLQRVLALPAATMRLDVVKTSIAGFAQRGIYADAKVMAHIEASTRGAKPQQRVIETLRRERWRKTSAGWRLIFSKTLAQTMRAK